MEEGEGVGGDDVRVGVEKEVFDPADVAVPPDSLAAVAERVGGSGHVLHRLRLPEEPDGFVLQSRHQVQWHAVVDQLKKPQLLAGADDVGLGVRVRQIHHRDSAEYRARLACLDQQDFVRGCRGLRHNYHID